MAKSQSQIIIYQTPQGNTNVQVRLVEEATVKDFLTVQTAKPQWQ